MYHPIIGCSAFEDRLAQPPPEATAAGPQERTATRACLVVPRDAQPPLSVAKALGPDGARVVLIHLGVLAPRVTGRGRAQHRWSPLIAQAIRHHFDQQSIAVLPH